MKNYDGYKWQRGAVVNRGMASEDVEFVRLVLRYGPTVSLEVEVSLENAAFADPVKQQLAGWRVKQRHPRDSSEYEVAVHRVGLVESGGSDLWSSAR